MKLNPSAVALWGLTTCIGWLIAPTLTGAVAGLTVGLGISVLSDLFFK